ncbi:MULTISPECIES: formimidoylglutamate deiminase [unclassified Beijerinckia]|uniref:formimidoylglutamate deiminase n=1 Tax=unclassified Beijerinckia TaxID=2638183 RepID=UPI00089A17E0|nr:MULTISPECIES: formimidoylglutamate deiminase [unclassified Beijerinckia]MDH7799090.1 formimidoylglutamate deiminase [Beijerinckia sp. GAS462]SED95373.1 formimidoylglutamate deiminase [Beijerinckia sp. 28-YEA-48]
MYRQYVFEHAWLPGGWARNVRVQVLDGIIAEIEPDALSTVTEMVPGLAVPGMPNLHSHAFQRGMAGLAERREPAGDSFWTWREVMYRFLDRLTPDDIEAIAALAYIEMLERGFTTVGEFHYLHHAPDGKPYDELGEIAFRIAAAAERTGIGLTLLPVLYGYAGFGALPPAQNQRRFINDPERFLRLVERTRAACAPLSAAVVGIAPHSLRAVTPETLRTVLEAVPGGPIHIHAAEQMKEVEDCVAWSGSRPIEWLLDHVPVDERWCLIHATHMTATETQRLAASRAIAGLCPLTEASLGDGAFSGAAYLAANGRFGIGSDSNIEIDAPGELRQLEYSQRIVKRARNVITVEEGESTGLRLYTEALKGGAQALGHPVGALAVGHRADIVVLDGEHAGFAGLPSDHWFDAWIFSAGRSAIRTVFTSGVRVVEDGHHRCHREVHARYRAVMKRLLDA